MTELRFPLSKPAMYCLLVLVAVPAGPSIADGDDDRSHVAEEIEARRAEYREIALDIWHLAEVGYQEVNSSEILERNLQKSGFHIQKGVADMPTAFVANRGSGRPVLAFLAEYDALPGISQQALPLRETGTKNAGHACGHNLLGTASIAAASVVAAWMEETGRRGTVRVYGTPAEEGGSGKVYMVRAGLFDDVDAVLSWHPADRNQASSRKTLANRSARFTFNGLSAHAAGEPEKGRSALDGVEAFDFMVNLMREHVPESTRIHYVITNGGAAPNVVPDRAEVYYYVRHPDVRELVKIWDRIVAASRGAAAGTGTSVEIEVMHGNYSFLPNQTLTNLMQENLRMVGGVHYSTEDRRFAEQLFDTLIDPDLPIGTESEVQPIATGLQMGSTDVGDISWVVPTGWLRTATWVPGTAAHTWQAIAAGGTEIGIQGMEVAAKTLAMAAVDLVLNPDVVAAAKQELHDKQGPKFNYSPMIGNRTPPLDYRRAQ